MRAGGLCPCTGPLTRPFFCLPPCGDECSAALVAAGHYAAEDVSAQIENLDMEFQDALVLCEDRQVPAPLFASPLYTHPPRETQRRRLAP